MNGGPGGSRRRPPPRSHRLACDSALVLRLVLRPLQHQPQLRHQSLSIRRSTCCGLTWRHARRRRCVSHSPRAACSSLAPVSPGKMARNEEKAQSMLNRWLAGKQQEVRGDKQKRPYLASECNDLNEADKWRQQILREIGRKVMDIQNAGLGEHRCGGCGGWGGSARAAMRGGHHRPRRPGAPSGGVPRTLTAASSAGCRIRDMNDEINKLIREKGHWERRIVELGGPDYSKTGPKVTDSEGRSLVEASGRGPGYRYFGAAKQLPGVRELFEKEAPRQVGGALLRVEAPRRVWPSCAIHACGASARVGVEI